MTCLRLTCLPQVRRIQGIHLTMKRIGKQHARLYECAWLTCLKTVTTDGGGGLRGCCGVCCCGVVACRGRTGILGLNVSW